jgi:hypothetical protein
MWWLVRNILFLPADSLRGLLNVLLGVRPALRFHRRNVVEVDLTTDELGVPIFSKMQIEKSNIRIAGEG